MSLKYNVPNANNFFIIGNHTLDFSGKTIHELGSEIRNRLNSMTVKNYNYLANAKINRKDDIVPDKEYEKKIKRKKVWTTNKKYFAEFYETWGYLKFSGPSDLEALFGKYYIQINDLQFCYKDWFKLDAVYQNEWRKYFYSLVHHFGGDRVIYLPNSELPSYDYVDYEGKFTELEKALKKEYGKSKEKLSRVSEKDLYFIDKLENID